VRRVGIEDLRNLTEPGFAKVLLERHQPLAGLLARLL
jgi:hypothetical protein